jgi:hypothetical protein
MRLDGAWATFAGDLPWLGVLGWLDTLSLRGSISYWLSEFWKILGHFSDVDIQ